MGVFSILILLPKLSKTCKKGEFFCPRYCWVKYWKIKVVKIPHFIIKKSVFFKTTKFAVSAWSIDQKTPENPPNLVKKRAKIQYFWKIHSLKQGFLLNRGFIEQKQSVRHFYSLKSRFLLNRGLLNRGFTVLLKKTTTFFQTILWIHLSFKFMTHYPRRQAHRFIWEEIIFNCPYLAQ